MAELINTNVFDATKKFVDFAGLDYFWEKAKAYIDGVDTAMGGRISALETTVSDENTGLVKKFADLKATVDALGDIEGGEGLAGMIDAKINALDVDDAAVAGEYVSSVSEVDGKVVVTRAALPDYTEVYDAKGAAATAEQNAKDYADGLAVNYDAAGTAAGLNAAMDTRVKVLEAIDHDKLAADASAAAVATVLDGAPEKFDTLKEIAQWISDSEAADSAADLVTRVSALEAIDHDAYKAADEATLASAKSYADGLAVNYDAAGSADGALASAKSYADGLKSEIDGVIEENERVTSEALTDLNTRVETLEGQDVYVKTDVDKQISDAADAAIAQAKADAADALKAYYTKTEVDNLLSTNSTGDRAYAKQYTDELFNSFQFAQNSDIDGLFA